MLPMIGLLGSSYDDELSEFQWYVSLSLVCSCCRRRSSFVIGERSTVLLCCRCWPRGLLARNNFNFSIIRLRGLLCEFVARSVGSSDALSAAAGCWLAGRQQSSAGIIPSECESKHIRLSVYLEKWDVLFA